MSAALATTALADALARLNSDLDALAGLPLEACSDAEVLDVWVGLERVRRRLDPVEYAVIGEVETRTLAFTQGARNTVALAGSLLRVSAGEAAGRVRAAAAVGPRRALSGEVLAPIYPGVAAAQARGDISARHGQVIVATVEKLPEEVRAELDRTVEDILLGYAREHAPDALAGFARDLAYRLDQDGQYREAARRERDRSVTLRRRVDGSGRLEAELTAEAAEHLHTHLDALTRPKPAAEGIADGVADPRTPGQRRHDALLDILKLVERAELLPHAAGIAATIIVTMDADTYTRTTRPGITTELANGLGNGRGTGIAPGSARTGHGYTIPADLAKAWAGPEARIIAVLLDKTKAITAYSSSHRIFTEQQRLALIARDQGCSFPGCDVGPQWTEAHHITEFRTSKRTSVDDACLLCSHHHRHFEAMGWTCRMADDGRPRWSPPDWLHPDLVPQPSRTSSN